MLIAKETIDRFESKYQRGNENDCWEFPGSFSLRQVGIARKTYSPYRISWMIANDQVIPDGKMICHHCDNPPCVNPRHLYMGTGFDNNRDTVRRGRAVRKLGEQCSWAKLTAKDVLNIRASTESQADIARRYKVSQSHISRIKSGDRNLWRTAIG